MATGITERVGIQENYAGHEARRCQITADILADCTAALSVASSQIGSAALEIDAAVAVAKSRIDDQSKELGPNALGLPCQAALDEIGRARHALREAQQRCAQALASAPYLLAHDPNAAVHQDDGDDGSENSAQGEDD